MSKKKFRFLEHTADMYIESWGDTLEEAFENAAVGLGYAIVVSDNVGKNVKKTIHISSEDKESLLFDFLSQFLILQDAEGLVFHNVKVKKIDEKEGKWYLRAEAGGEKYNPEKHEEGTHVKAITYHYMEIKKENNKYIIKVLIDI